MIGVDTDLNDDGVSGGKPTGKYLLSNQLVDPRALVEFKEELRDIKIVNSYYGEDMVKRLRRVMAMDDSMFALADAVNSIRGR